MAEPPDDIFSSESVEIAGGFTVDSVSDWESIGFSNQLTEDGRVVFNVGVGDINLNLTPEHWEPPALVNLSVDITLENESTEDEIEIGTVTVELLDDSEEVVSSDTEESVTLSLGEERDVTLSLYTAEFGWHTIRASAEDKEIEESVEIVSHEFEISNSYPETITTEQDLDITTTIRNNRSFTTEPATLTVGLNEDEENITGRVFDVPELESFGEFESIRTIPNQYLDVGMNTVGVSLSSDQLENEMVSMEEIEVIEAQGVNLIGELIIENHDLAGGSPGFVNIEPDFELENVGGEVASDVTAELMLYKDGNPLEIFSQNTWSTSSIEPSGTFTPFISVWVGFEERGEHTAEMVVDADELDDPIVFEDTMHLVDQPGEAILGTDIIGVDSLIFTNEKEFDVTIDEESGTPAEDLVVEVTIRDSDDVVVFEEAADDLPELSLETETLSFTATELPVGEYDIEVTADAKNATEEIVETAQFEVVDSDELDLTVSISADGTAFGGEAEVTATIANQMDQDATGVEGDFFYYEQDDNLLTGHSEDPNPFDVGTIPAGESETVEHTQIITECWQTEILCAPDADAETGEYQVEIHVEADQLTDNVVREDNFHVWD